MKKVFLILPLIAAALVFGVIYVNNQYFFSPISFNKDPVTPYSWDEYERPLELKLYSFEEGRQSEKIEREREIREVLSELKESPQSSSEEVGSPEEVNGGLTLKSNGRTLLEVLFYPNHWEILKKDGPVFELTDSLKQVVDRF
ncbi:hypothetical protein [Halobacillus campisalis]|uniref:Uncharacterized protein n=1 Tax=Halobacillus campisalis TaxID=435909 RepID=A0ABW2K9V2_9BACI|nr:hypothetical protein [Halobacillus campisalis]